MAEIKIKKSTRKTKKLMAIIKYENGDVKKVHFGAQGMNDYLTHKYNIRDERKKLYIDRHKKRESKFWKTRFDMPSTLSRYILWGPTTNLEENIKAYKKRFNLK